MQLVESKETHCIAESISSVAVYYWVNRKRHTALCLCLSAAKDIKRFGERKNEREKLKGSGKPRIKTPAIFPLGARSNVVGFSPRNLSRPKIENFMPYSAYSRKLPYLSLCYMSRANN